MAKLAEFTCNCCGKNRRQIKDPYNICVSCRIKKDRIAKNAYLDEKKVMPIEKRLEAIEEYIYDMDFNDRLKHIESQDTQD